MSIRLNVVAEGQTEQNFVSRVLCGHLIRYDIISTARCVMTGRDNRRGRVYKGGMRNYDKAKNDLKKWMNEDKSRDCRFTTMFDFYGLPADFPSFDRSQTIKDPYQKVEFLEQAFRDDINDDRFIPYIQLHEFEALIFSKPCMIAKEYFEYQKEIDALIKNVQDINNPELIDSGNETAPSKRIIKAISVYDKLNAGIGIVLEIGLDTVRGHCRHFNQWLTKLENLKN